MWTYHPKQDQNGEELFHDLNKISQHLTMHILPALPHHLKTLNNRTLYTPLDTIKSNIGKNMVPLHVA